MSEAGRFLAARDFLTARSEDYEAAYQGFAWPGLTHFNWALDYFDVYAQGNHSADMLIAYLPKEKILFNADLYSPPAQGAPTPAPTAGMRTLNQNILKLKLDVAQHVPAHGRAGTHEEFLKIVGSAPASERAEAR